MKDQLSGFAGLAVSRLSAQAQAASPSAGLYSFLSFFFFFVREGLHRVRVYCIIGDLGNAICFRKI